LSINEIQSTDWDQLVLKPETPVVVEFWHQECPTCKKMEQSFHELPSKFSGVMFLRMNVLTSRENRRYAIQNGVMGTPTLKVYCRGVEVGEVVGLDTLEALDRKVKAILDKCG
jgi:thioredoxin 1